jgi:uncharacterized delta-60 repeat protein
MNKHSILAVFFLFAFVHETISQSIDSTFGNNGIEQINFGFYPSYFSDMELQDDGKIIMVSYNSQVIDPLMITRRLPNGNADNTFGDNGQVRTTFGYQYCDTYEIEQLSDGGILIAGMADGKSAMLKLTENGSIDSTFGTNGRVIYSFGPSVGSRIRSLEIDQNNRIIAVGEAYNYDNLSFDMAAIRFNSNGSVDSSFGISGNIKIDMQGRNDLGSCSALLPDGKILFAGNAMNNDGNTNFAMMRLSSDGTLDLSFGNAGKVILTINSGYNETFENLHILEDQSILTVGTSAGDFAVLKFDASGNNIQAFGNQGYTTIDFDDYQDNGFEILIDEENRILLGGYGSDVAVGGLFHAAMVRLTPDGQMDASFGTNGKWINTLGQTGSEIYSMKWLSDGKLQIAGANIPLNQSDVQPFLARIIVDNPTGIVVENHPINSLFPNPASDVIYLTNTKIAEPFEIFDITGKCILKGTIENSKIKVDSLSNGTYFLYRNSGINQKFILIR